MRKGRKYIYLGCILFLPIAILAQFTIPKVPAEVKTYKEECLKIKASGVKQRSDIKYIINEGKVTTEKYKDKQVKFGDDGEIKEFIYIDKDGREKAIVLFDYYKNGLPKSETEFHPTGELLKRTEYIYNYEGQLLEKKVIDQYEFVQNKVEYLLDESAQTLTEKLFAAPQMVTEKNLWVYSNINTGKLIKNEKYDGETLLMYRRIFVYENSLLKQEEYYNPAGQKAFYLEYSYDPKNNLAEIEKVLLNGTRLKNAVYQYSTEGLLLGKIEYDRNGKMTSYYKYSYEK
jgi:hypothetical protein